MSETRELSRDVKEYFVYASFVQGMNKNANHKLQNICKYFSCKALYVTWRSLEPGGHLGLGRKEVSRWRGEPRGFNQLEG